MSEKSFKIDTTSEFGSIYINNPDGEHMSWIEVERTLNQQRILIDLLKKDLNKLYKLLLDKGMSHKELQEVLWYG